VVGRLAAAVARLACRVPTLLDLAVNAVVAYLHTSVEPSNVLAIPILPSELQERIDSAASGTSYNPPPLTRFLRVPLCC
jgi:hypothetical protein